MAIITLDEAKTYLRVDYADEDELITNFISTAEKLVQDMARLSDDDWSAADEDTLAAKSRDGYGAQVRELIARHGGSKLSDIDPSEYGAMLKEAEVFGHAT